MNKTMTCKECLAWVIMEDSGWLIPHTRQNKFGAEICPNREPLPSRPEEYPVGFDSEPRWVMRGGLPETDRRKF